MFASLMTLVVIPALVYSIKNKQHEADNLNHALNLNKK